MRIMPDQKLALVTWEEIFRNYADRARQYLVASLDDDLFAMYRLKLSGFGYSGRFGFLKAFLSVCYGHAKFFGWRRVIHGIGKLLLRVIRG